MTHQILQVPAADIKSILGMKGKVVALADERGLYLSFRAHLFLKIIGSGGVYDPVTVYAPTEPEKKKGKR